MAYIGPLAAAENALYLKDNVGLQISKEDIGKGHLVITERAFMWRPENSNDGISIPWTSISLHAIAADPVRSIYMQLAFRLDWPGVYEWKRAVHHQGPNGNAEINNGMNGEAERDDANEDVDEGNVSDSSDDEVATEIHIIPQDENDINQIYYAMNHCQTMNPDPNESISEDDEEDFMEAEGDDSDDAGHGDMRNLHLNDDDQFADD